MKLLAPWRETARTQLGLAEGLDVAGIDARAARPGGAGLARSGMTEGRGGEGPGGVGAEPAPGGPDDPGREPMAPGEVHGVDDVGQGHSEAGHERGEVLVRPARDLEHRHRPPLDPDSPQQLGHRGEVPEVRAAHDRGCDHVQVAAAPSGSDPHQLIEGARASDEVVVDLPSWTVQRQVEIGQAGLGE